MPQMPKKLIIFDLDGVLFDTSKLVSAYFLDLYPTMTEKLVKELLCGNFHHELEKAKLLHKPKAQSTDEHKAAQTAYSMNKANSSLFPDINRLLLTLQQAGHTLTINTSAYEQNCLPLLEKAGILKFFDFIATAELSKSKVEKFELIRKKYLNQPESIFITDTLGDIREADEAHVPTIAVTWGAHDRSYFTREPHQNLIGIVDSLTELADLILL